MDKLLVALISVFVLSAQAPLAQSGTDDDRGDFLGPIIDFNWTIVSDCPRPLQLAVRYTEDGVRHTQGWLVLHLGQDVTFRSTSNFVFYYARMDGFSWRGEAENEIDILIGVDLEDDFAYREDNSSGAAIDQIRFRGRERAGDTTTTLTCQNQ